MTDRKMIKLDEELSAKYKSIFKIDKATDLPDDVEFYVVQGLVLACHPGNTSECIGLVDLRVEDQATVEYNNEKARSSVQAQIVIDVTMSSASETRRDILSRLAYAVSGLMESSIPFLGSDIQVHSSKIHASYSDPEEGDQSFEVPVYEMLRPLDEDSIGLDAEKPALLFSRLPDGHMLMISGSDDVNEHFVWVGETPQSPACSDVFRFYWDAKTHSLQLNSMSGRTASIERLPAN